MALLTASLVFYYSILGKLSEYFVASGAVVGVMYLIYIISSADLASIVGVVENKFLRILSL